MAYLATDRARRHRADPHQVFSEVRSIIVLGIPYASPQSISTPEDGRLHGRVAAYAWGDDYHHILTSRLNALSGYTSEAFSSDATWRSYSDTAPILEHDMAQNAGLGWIGKNTCLIDPHRGSYFLLAEIFLSLPLEPNQAFQADRCGTCTRCIDACPTGCILPDRTLDARRCISYLTIEKRGPIDRSLRPLMGNWVFGCDICQQVCPWNIRFASMQGDPSFQSRPGVPYPDLLEELELTPEDFNQKYHLSPVKRAKRRGYLRNVMIALGNSHDQRAVAALEKVLRTEVESLVRCSAAWALHQIGGAKTVRALSEAAHHETEPLVLAEINGI